MAKSPAAPQGKDKEENGAAQAAGPALSVLVQYIKDLSFENPNAPNSLRPREKAPEININVNVSVNGLSKTDFEVSLKLDARGGEGSDVLFNAELLYAGVFRLQGVPEEAVRAALLIECPRLLFPFARQIIADAIRNGGFPPLMIEPIDFVRLYQQRIAEEARAKPTN
jgi:preprotein translocase subunit SecB